MSTIAASPKVLRLLAATVVARFPLAMLSIALLVHTRQLTGSFAASGLVTGAYAAALGISGPALGRLVDRRGQTAVLLASAAALAALLLVTAALPHGAPVGLLVALALAIGTAVPPVGACTRALFPALLDDPAALRASYAAEASAIELTWIAGPPAALALGALWSTGGALVVAALMVLVATLAFAAQPVSREWRPAPGAQRPRGGSLRAPAMRTLMIVLVGVGVVFGATEVAVTAAAAAGSGGTAAAAPLLGLWGAGSLIGGMLCARAGGGASTAGGLALVLGALAGGHLALAGAAGSVVALGAVIVVAGAAIAPTYASVYAMVDAAAPAGTVTEAFAWLSTAIAVGSAAGAAMAGALADQAGPSAGFVLAGGAGALAMVVTLLRSRTLPAAGPAALADAAAA